VYPAIAVAQGLVSDQVFFVGSTERLESDLITRAGFRFKGFRIPRRQPWVWLNAIAAMVQAFRVEQVRVVVCFGGYVCFPACVAAKLLDIPILLHEQNKIMGRLNRLMASWAVGIGLSFKGTTHAERMPHTRVVGCPVRNEFFRASDPHPAASVSGGAGRHSASEFNLRKEMPTLVVLGGSQGAQFLNDWVLYLIKNPPTVSGQIFLSTGEKAWHPFLSAVSASDAQCESWVWDHGQFRIVAQPYVHNMPGLLSQCQAFVARAGASSLAEMAVMGVPGIVIPYPYAKDRHQDANARAYAMAGAVTVLKQEGLSDWELWQAAESVWLQVDSRDRMAGAMHRLSPQGAVSSMLKWIQEFTY
jgi:UDP-N-acetylglucosamine--N-acetylmuramyl-(pentapeptide) pyrophosphoryl-undecaprenol N-acetylglucosamine transferase